MRAGAWARHRLVLLSGPFQSECKPVNRVQSLEFQVTRVCSQAGVGASCIYALLACRLHADWTMAGTDVDPTSLATAQANVERNGMADRITLVRTRYLPIAAVARSHPHTQVHNTDPARVLRGVVDRLLDTTGPFAFCMCNPPFFDETAASSRTPRRPAAQTANTAARGEQITEASPLSS